MFAGKTMENLRRRIKVELVVCPRRMQKLINKPTFKHAIRYNDNLSAVSIENKVIEFCKPVYIGFAVLEVSKTLMYDYHYNVMKKHYDDKISLMYTDTGIYILLLLSYNILIFILYFSRLVNIQCAYGRFL